ncbi:MAG TPA: winged helix-turn-helix domain-containing protein [Microbacterium sp.]|nr:winged helix-turn-helix domain-containing protein [Microbacterium sp.]
MDEPDDEELQAGYRALSSPLRLRILRLCAFDARTNKELAELLDVNPGTMLHHVRTLVSTGFLEAQRERIGERGAREVPYLATGKSWRTRLPEGSTVLLDTFLQQVAEVPPDQVEMSWLGLRLNAEHKAELDRRLAELLNEFKDSGPDADGDPFSLVTVLHPDRNPRPGAP